MLEAADDFHQEISKFIVSAYEQMAALATLEGEWEEEYKSAIAELEQRYYQALHAEVRLAILFGRSRVRIALRSRPWKLWTRHSGA